MVDERTLELIHAELDDELDAGAQAELERRLEATPDARGMREELQRISQALGRIAPAEPPLALRSAVLGAIRPVVRARPARLPVRHRGWALAAGMAIGALGMLLMLGIETLHPEPSELNPRMLAGTIAEHAPEAARITAPTLRIASPELRGSVTLQTADDVYVVYFDLDSATPVTVQADFDAPGLRFLGFAPGDAVETSLTTTPGSVAFVNRGTQQSALFFAPEAGGPIRLRFEASGRTMREDTIEIPAAAPGREP